MDQPALKGRGHLLAELVLSLALLSVVFLALLQLFPASFLTHNRARHQMEANQALENLLEECQRLPVSALLPLGVDEQNYTTTAPGPLGEVLQASLFPSGGKLDLECRVEAQRRDARGNPLLIRVVAEVRWQAEGRNFRREREQWLADITR